MTLPRCLALFLALGFLSPAFAAEATVTCKDGTTSKGGQGACSGHGGVEKKTAKAGSKEVTAPAAAPKKAKKEESKPKAAEEAAATVVCKDGTTSKGGQGACSGHGGVEKKGKVATAPPASPASAPAPVPAPAPRAASTPAPAAAKHAEGTAHANPANTDPAGAIAKCKDGTYSHAKGHSGACSQHGGVADWLDKK